MEGDHNWLVRFYREDQPAQAFWSAVLDGLPKPVRTIDPGDDPQLLTYLVTRALH